jgi:hypothetical protein
VAIAATVIEKSHFKGQTAFTVCRVSESITCADGLSGQLDTNVFLSGDEFSSRSLQFPDDAQNNVFATVVQSSTCTEELTASFGSVSGGFTWQGLQSAQLQGSFPLQSFDEGGPSGTIDLALSLEGFGETRKDGEKFKFDFETEGGLVVISGAFSGKSRSAAASGTVILNGTELSCAFDEGTLADSKSGYRETLR